MSETNYKEKYLKYKNKYIELKSHVNSYVNLQTGGYAYFSGKYVFFIPERMGGIVDSIGFDKVIKSLDNFTTALGNCTKFIRIGTTTTGSDITHQFDTIYSNQSSLSVVSRESSKAYKETSDAAKVAYDTTSKVAKVAYDATSKAAIVAYDTTSKAIKNIQTELNKDNIIPVPVHVLEPVQIPVQIPQSGGEDDCNKLPLRLSDLGLNGFSSLLDIKEDILPKYIESINAHQGKEKIGRVIVVEKTGTIGKVYLYLDYKVSYSEDNVVVKKN